MFFLEALQHMLTRFENQSTQVRTRLFYHRKLKILGSADKNVNARLLKMKRMVFS